LKNSFSGDVLLALLILITFIFVLGQNPNRDRLSDADNDGDTFDPIDPEADIMLYGDPSDVIDEPVPPSRTGSAVNDRKPELVKPR